MAQTDNIVLQYGFISGTAQEHGPNSYANGLSTLLGACMPQDDPV